MSQQSPTDQGSHYRLGAGPSEHGNSQQAEEQPRPYSNETSKRMPLLTSSASHHGSGTPMPSRTFELPPLPPMSRSHTHTGSGFSTQGSTRASTIHTATKEPAQYLGSDSPRRRKIPQIHMNNDQSVPSLLPPIKGTEHTRQDRPTLPSLSPSPQPFGLDGRSVRSILTPQSLLEKNTSVTHLRPGQGKISAKAVPFLPASPSSDTYARDFNNAPTPPSGAIPIQAYRLSSIGSSAAPQADPRRPSPSITSAGFHAPSGSASPSGSYVSYTQHEQTSPGTKYHLTNGAIALSRYPGSSESNTSANEFGHPDYPHGSDHRAMSIPVSTSGGTNTYQMMTIQTSSGTVQVPVDVQAASKLADEKRKRNAGASARFRERRKKKEVESSVTIRKLETQVKDLAEDAEHYKRERDYLASVVLKGPEGQRHFPRPQSPRLRRIASVGCTGTSSSTTSEYTSGPEQSVQGSESDRNVRRRTGSFTSEISMASAPPQMINQPPRYVQQTITYQHQQAPAMQHQQPLPPPPRSNQAPPPLPPPPHASHESYMLQGYPTEARGPFAGQTGQALPPLHDGPPQVMQAPPSTGPFNPYASQRYDLSRATTNQPPEPRQ